MLRQRTQFHEREAREWSQTFRGSKQAWLLVFAGNALLLMALLGVPYLRGQARARATWTAYDALARCVFPGAPPRSLSRSETLRPEEVAAYAGLAVRGGGTALAGCREALRAVAPRSDIFVLPGLKAAEETLREAVRVAEHELSAVPAHAEPGARLSLRPLQALEQLRSVVEKHSEEAGLVEMPHAPRGDPRSEAVPLPMPARVPLYAGADAVISLWGTDSTLHAVGFDRTGISYVEIENRVLTRARLVRPKLLRDLLLRDGALSLVWGMAPARCHNGRCAGKATGIARASLPFTALPEPRWLAGHLNARVDRTLIAIEQRVFLLAESAGLAELRGFPFAGDEHQPAAGEALPPLAPSGATWSVAQPAGALVTRGGSAPVVLSTLSNMGATQVLASTRNGSVELASLTGEGPAWTLSCVGAEGTGFAAGSATQLVLGEFAGNHARWEPLTVSLGNPIHESDRTRDRMQLLCTPAGLLAFALDLDHELHSIHCARGEPRCVRSTVAERVGSFALSADENGVLLALGGTDAAPQIRVTTADWRGVAHDQERIPSVCWAPRGGLCGHPTLASLGSRIVLATRDGTDLLALESADSGVSWSSLHGAEPDSPTAQLARPAAQRRRESK